MTAALIVFSILFPGLIPAAIARRKGRSFFLWWLYGAVLFVIALPHAIITESLDEGGASGWRAGDRSAPESGRPLTGNAADGFDNFSAAQEGRTETDPTPLWDDGFTRIGREESQARDNPATQPMRPYWRPFPAAIALLSGGMIAVVIGAMSELPAPAIDRIDRTAGQSPRDTGNALLQRDPALTSRHAERRQPVDIVDDLPGMSDLAALSPPPPPPTAVDDPVTAPLTPLTVEEGGQVESAVPKEVGGPVPTTKDDEASAASPFPQNVGSVAPDDDKVHTPAEENEAPLASTRSEPGPAAAPAEDVQAVGETVAWLQRGLRKFGFYDGPIDGRAGALTEQAIRDYQRSRHLTPHGRIDYALLVSLRRSLRRDPADERGPSR